MSTIKLGAHIYASCLLPDEPSLDPLITTDHRSPTAHPSSIPAGYWPVARRTLASLSRKSCLVRYPLIGNLFDMLVDKPWVVYDEWRTTYGKIFIITMVCRHK